MSLEVRTIGDPDLPDWIRAMHTGFLRPPTVTKEEIETRRAGTDLERAQGAFDAEQCVGTFRSFPQRITVPGGAAVAASAVSNVTVSATHRRRGLLSRMMEHDLRAARDRGEVAATLLASEWLIYGRYGFGPAAWVSEWEVDVARAGLDKRYAGPADGGRVDFVDAETVRRLGPALHERLRAVRHGVVDRTERWWRLATGDIPQPGMPAWTEPYYALYRSPEGSVDGLVSYTCDEVWDGKRPQNTATVHGLIAVSTEAERALWHFLLSVDWVTKVASGFRAPDDILPLLLPDPRAAKLTLHSDYLWLRPLDVPALLEARTYACPGSLVLDVTDPGGHAGGRFLLEVDPGGTSCTPSKRPAELSLGVAELASLYLGDESAVRLATLGRLDEERTGAAQRAELMLRTARRPWCPDHF
ncbi:GNAT family N-acetyltransferase [Streptomyces sp. NPDC021096]|uniref:GNAT family N-acetyltransferase n=1 Tax=Streptomyces sp. NPDC021096 TaxID=3154792 RepID=UPI0033E37069